MSQTEETNFSVEKEEILASFLCYSLFVGLWYWLIYILIISYSFIYLFCCFFFVISVIIHCFVMCYSPKKKKKLLYLFCSISCFYPIKMLSPSLKTTTTKKRSSYWLSCFTNRFINLDKKKKEFTLLLSLAILFSFLFIHFLVLLLKKKKKQIFFKKKKEQTKMTCFFFFECVWVYLC